MIEIEIDGPLNGLKLKHPENPDELREVVG
jgi:hypothetical protein